MKIEIEIPDLETIYCDCYEDYGVTGKELNKIIADIAIQKFIDKMYDDYMNDVVYESVRYDVKETMTTIGIVITVKLHVWNR